MIKYNKPFASLFLVLLLIFPGCMHVPTYRSQALKDLPFGSTKKQTENNVSLQAKQLTTREIGYLFGPENKCLMSNIIIIQLSICNMSGTDYLLTPESVTLKALKYRDVFKFIKKTNTASRFAGAAVSGFFVSPFFFDTTLSALARAGFPGIVAVPLVMVPMIVALPMGIVFLAEGIKSAVMNRRIKKDLKEKMIHKKVIIKAGHSYDGLMCVNESDYNSTFDLTLEEKKDAQHTIIFNVDMHYL